MLVALQPVPQGSGIGVMKRQFLCQTSLFSFVKQSFVSLARGEILAKWQEKRHEARRDEMPYLRMMDHSSHSERKHSSKINALREYYRSRVQ
jgi:hypothetical protein